MFNYYSVTSVRLAVGLVGSLPSVEPMAQDEKKLEGCF